jgi:beta-glucosidase-like glycosyl hydrolase
MVSLLNGQVPVARLDDMVLRILTAMYMVGIMDTPQVSCAPTSTSAPTRL